MEDKESELKKEYNKVHERYTEVGCYPTSYLDSALYLLIYIYIYMRITCLMTEDGFEFIENLG